MPTQLLEDQAIPAGKHALIVLDHTGDTRHMWDPDNADEVRAARSTFDMLKAKGHTAYTVNEDDGEKGRVIREFDPKAGKMIMVPKVVGG